MLNNKRIMHISNIIIKPEDILSYGDALIHSGGWIVSMLSQIFRATDHKIAVVSLGDVSKINIFKSDRITAYVMPNKDSKTVLKELRDLVDVWNPDLIHIHGTEQLYGLLSARNMIAFPTVISLQGMLGPCSEWYRYFGNRSVLDIFRMHRWLEFPAFRGHWRGFHKIRQAAKREREIIRGNHFFMGRTAWDRAYVKSLNPQAEYLHGGELLREAFWQKHWNLGQAQRHRVIFTNCGHPRKGTEVLLDAVALLRSEFPDIQVGIAGGISRRSGYGRYIRRRIEALGTAAVELGQLNAEQMVEELARSHVFVSPSFIDNSPNAVCEAQLLGMPVVSTYTGGVPSLVEEGRTGLFFPTGDVPMLAARLREIFMDDELAIRLGEQARKAAVVRHDPDTVVQQVLTAYEHVLRMSTSNHSDKGELC